MKLKRNQTLEYDPEQLTIIVKYLDMMVALQVLLFLAVKNVVNLRECYGYNGKLNRAIAMIQWRKAEIEWRKHN
jgi:hypothetical protein